MPSSERLFVRVLAAGAPASSRERLKERDEDGGRGEIRNRWETTLRATASYWIAPSERMREQGCVKLRVLVYVRFHVTAGIKKRAGDASQI